MIKIIIYETTHFENLPALLELCAVTFSSITVFLPEHSHRQILPVIKTLNLPVSVSFEVQTSGVSNRKFIQQFFRHLKAGAYTHLHINTLDHNVLYFTWLLRMQKIHISLTVHSINEYKTYMYNSLKAITESIAKKWLHKNIRQYRVLAPGMQDYFKQVFPGKTAHYIPGYFFDKKPASAFVPDAGFFTIVIPGTVEAKRRDYDLVVDFFTNHLSQHTAAQPLRLILAGNGGSAFGTTVIGKLQSLCNENFSFIFFSEDVQNNEYNRFFCEADIVWNPIITHTLSRENIPEKSSVTHSPGFITDQVHFGIPCIVPADIQVHEWLKDCNFYYKNAGELYQIFLCIFAEKNLCQVKRKQTLQACEHFNIINFQEAFRLLIT